ncbi:hypothetical protein JTB14_018441 [Gonioctena quinquepunctata]|nr:hypothetical protein JTB14_018441 [Gonioctena quinquepunctata]
MDSSRPHLVLAVCLLWATFVYGSQGPVFINPNNAPIAVQTASANPGNVVTQTVYGFLDFTTTIGNTVMVFSPQSAAIPEPPKVISNDISSNIVIETKPLVAQKATQIKPSKTQVSKEKKSSEKVFSVVQVQSNSPTTQSEKVELQSSAITKVNVIEGKSSVKEAHPPLHVVSNIQVVESPSIKSTTTHNIITKVEVVSVPTKSAVSVIASKVEVQSRKDASPVSSVVQVKSDEEPAVIIGNNIGEPEYDFLSRQPSEVVEETFKVINLKPSSKFILKHKPSTELRKNAASKRSGAQHPTGLVTKLGGTVVKDGITTVIETSVIGTYISGKYAQVLQSNSRKISPTQSLRILKTAAPSLGKGNKHRHIEPTPTGFANEEAGELTAQNFIKSTRKANGNSGSFKRFKNRHKEPDVIEEDNEHDVTVAQPNYKKSQKNRSHSQTSRNSNEEPPTSAPSGKRFSGRKNKQTSRPANSDTSYNSGYSRRGYKPKVQPSSVEQNTATTSSVYKFKLNRSPGRWQYKTTSKPRVTIRKQNNIDEATNNNETLGTTSSSPQEAAQLLINDVVSPQARSDDGDSLEGSESIASIIDDESSTENKLDAPAFPVETIKVEISTPPDFGDIYYEIATIKSPYTFQVGSVRNTRYVTVTSTFEKSLEHSPDPTSAKASEPLTENILATSSNYGKDNNFLDSSVATLPPIYLASDMETPPLETLTETFSTTQTMLKTHILPVVRSGNDTSSSTLVQTYLVTRLVTATKTLPPMDAYHFNPSRTLNEFNSHLDEAGSELHLELEFGDQNEQDEGHPRKISLPADLDLANIGSNFDLSEVEKSKLLEGHIRPKKAQSPPKLSMNDLPIQSFNPDQLQQLALYRLLNPAAAQAQVITTSKPILKVETVYDTYILPVTQGHNTIQSTISKLKGTFTRTDYEFGTSTIAPALPLPQHPQLPPQYPQLQPQLPQQLPQLNPFLPQPQYAVTSSAIVQTTMVTQTNSKVLKLTFGAKTAHTTVYSTVVIPTVTTSYVTASVPVPVAPTAAYPGYFPAPFPGYPYVG